jgi:hypothetical protein
MKQAQYLQRPTLDEKELFTEALDDYCGLEVLNPKMMVWTACNNFVILIVLHLSMVDTW